MSTRPSLSRSVPFWLLLVGSIASVGAGVYVLIDKLGGMDARLVDQTATSSDVYVGQIWAVFGAILVGAGLVGFALTLTVAALKALVPAAQVATDSIVVIEDVDATTDDEVDAVPAVSTPAATESVADKAEDAVSEKTEDAVSEKTEDDFGYRADLGYTSNERADAPETAQSPTR